MLDDEPTTTSTSTTSGDAAGDPPTGSAAKKAPRRRATKAPAAPEVAPETGNAADTAADAGPAPAAAADGDTAVEAKAAKKAPAKRAPRKAAAKKAAAVEDDPVVAESIADDTTVAALAPEAPTTPAASDSAGGPEAPAAARPRTRRRASIAVPFQPPVVEEAVEEPVDEPADDEELEDPVTGSARTEPGGTGDVGTDEPAAATDGEQTAPRRRRRAGTSGVIAPATFLAPEPVDGGPEADASGALDAPDGPAEDDDEDDPDRPRSRRRRGRRGRGRRPDGSDDRDGGDDSDPEGATPATGTSAPDGTEEDEDDDDTSAAGTARRRRRRRRSGGSGGAGDGGSDDPPGTVVHVREPQARSQRVRGASAADEDGVRGITGSTRMAAKRARRQEGRDSGRRRPPILTEAEFLARREAVDRKMIVRQKGERTQIAVLEDDILVEHYVTKASAQSFAGNVYLGRVQNVLPSMEAAFVDIGKGRNAVLYAGEVNYELLGSNGGGGSRKIEQVLKSGQEVLVQVTKDPMGHKGARLTSQISLPGRYLVYVPEGSMTGISRKLPENERTRLKSILKRVVPEDAGVIIRTAAEGVGEEEIERDVRRLQAQWEVIRTRSQQGGAPTLLHAEPDLVIKVVRDVFNEDFSTLVVQGDSEWSTIQDYVEFVAPDLASRLSRHEGDVDVFAAHRIDEQIAKALERKVWLPSGGSLVIDRTEAMVVIDVNTGKYVGKGGNLEETVTRNNLEAAEEVARQLRLRDLGGIIVVDFIDMVLESNRDLVVRRLVECLGRDRTKHQVAEVTSLGLVQMTRKRVGQGLLESFSETCEHCSGRGYLTHAEPLDRKESSERFDDRSGSEQAEKRRRDRERGPKPGAPVRAAGAEPSPRATGSTSSTASTADAAPGEDDAPAGPKRRRRGGRGAGSATPPAAALDPALELRELETGDVAGEAPPEPAVEPDADPAAGHQPGAQDDAPDVADAQLAVSGVHVPLEPAPLPELAEQPPSDVEDVAVLPAALASVRDPEPATPEAPVRPRRRRATSRPAGPPAAG